jgi:hypothetical protein
VYQFSYGGDDTTCRRCWGRWEGSTDVGPKLTLTVAYNNYRALVENFVGTWTEDSMPAVYTLQLNGAVWTGPEGGTFSNGHIDQPVAVIGDDRLDGDPNAFARVLGSIAYVGAAARFPAEALTEIDGMDNVTVQDSAAAFEPGSHTGMNTFWLQDGSSGVKLTASHLTSLGGGGPSISSQWTQTAVEQGAAFANLSGIYSGTAGARICNRIVDGVTTTVPLWPWPMNQRILDATTFAAAANHQHWIYQGNPVQLTLVTSPHAPADVTADVEKFFGPIPSACRR